MRSTAWRTSSRSDLLLRSAVTLVAVGAIIAALLNVPRYDYSWPSVWRDGDYASFYLVGIWVTLRVSVLAMLLALVFGFVAALMRMARNVVANQLGTLYVEIVRGTPLLVQILIALYVVAFGIRLALEAVGAPAALLALPDDRELVGVVALGVFGGAYVAEIVRAAMESIDPGQTEAALAQGMTRWQTQRHVLLPQALRRMLPPLTGQLVTLVKDSSLLMIIGVLELTKRGYEVWSSTYKTFEVFLPMALFYFVICFAISRLARWLEIRLADA